MPKSASYIRHGQGLTFIELIIVIACIGILSAILLSAWLQPRIYAGNTIGMNKQPRLSFRASALENQENYPIQIPVTDGGALDTAGTGSAFMHFSGGSNELSAPFLNHVEIPLKP